MEAQPDAIIRDPPPDARTRAAVNPGRELFEANTDLINEVITSVCRKNRLNAAYAEEFQSDVHYALIKDEYRALNQFEGRSALKTFLRIVITNELRDFRDRKWGKFRPSAQAVRLGRRGIAIDELLHRDGWAPDEAFRHLRTNLGWDITRAEFDDIVARLPWHGLR